MHTHLSNVRTLIVVAIAALTLIILSPNLARAATFSVSLNKQLFPLGDEFVADIKMDTEGVGINASQGTISFSPDVLSVSKIDRSNSIFNFWINEPAFANDAGTISFLGGSTSGFTGSSLEVFRVTFKVKGIGKSTITFTDGAITASDGSGTNVMRGTKGVEITSASKSEITAIAPAQITRAPATATGLPTKPKLTVSLYPNPDKWYNISARFNVKFNLPPDVSDVATLISKDPRAIPPRSEGLFDNKDFDALGDGIWYLHVQFKNNVGWGPSEHYRLAIDTAPPLPFTIKAAWGNSDTNPSPTLSYASADSLSGISQYQIIADQKEVVSTTSTSYTLPPQAPGKHHIRVSAHDAAENITENTYDIIINPIASPTMTLVSKDVFTNEGGVGLSGTALAKARVLLTLNNESGTVFFEEYVDVDANGNWSAVFNKPLGNGTYIVRATTVDERGAQSQPVALDPISVIDRPLLTVFGIAITQMRLIWILLIILLGGFAGGFILNNKLKKQRETRLLIATRDIVNAFKMTKTGITKAIGAFADKKLTSEELTNVEFTLKQTVASVERMEKYITENISEINE